MKTGPMSNVRNLSDMTEIQWSFLPSLKILPSEPRKPLKKAWHWKCIAFVWARYVQGVNIEITRIVVGVLIPV